MLTTTTQGFNRANQEGTLAEGMVDNLAIMTSQIARFRPYMQHDVVTQVAFLSNSSAAMAPFLHRLGWETRVLDLKVQPSDVRNPKIAEEIVKDGAIGIWEMLKLEPWRPSVLKLDVDFLLMVDTDVHFRQPFDEVFANMSSTATLGYTNGEWAGEKVNGGFLVVRPGAESEKDYHNIMEVLKEGDFRTGQGWRGKTGWTYGGRTMQGLLPYYYLYGAGKDRSSWLDRCIVNNMVNSDLCEKYDPQHILINHFTGGCQKPWWCQPGNKPLCHKFYETWWEGRADARTYFSLPGTDSRCSGRYKAMGFRDDRDDWGLPSDHPAVPE